MTEVKSVSKAGAGWVAEVHLLTYNRVFGACWRREAPDKVINFVSRNCATFFTVDKGRGVMIRFPIPPTMPVHDLRRRMP